MTEAGLTKTEKAVITPAHKMPDACTWTITISAQGAEVLERCWARLWRGIVAVVAIMNGFPALTQYVI